MGQPGTFDRVYSAIKRQLASGSLRPGTRLEPAALSEELNASVTPVRDALHRLTGEGLVEAPRHDGFRAPLLTEATLRHLYAWHLDLLLLATARRSAVQRLSPQEPEPESPAEGLKAAFAEVAAGSGNPEHSAALRNVAERLAPFHAFEGEFLDALEMETEQIISAIRRRDRKALRASLVQYHRRRQKLVPELLERLQHQS